MEEDQEKQKRGDLVHYNESIRYKEIPVPGKKAFPIVLGSTAFGMEELLEKTFEYLEEYCALGGNWIDTARVYGRVLGDSERAIGEWLREKKCRDRMILGTKGGHPPFEDMHAGRLDRESLRFDIEASLENLGVSGMDVYYLHRDDVSRPVGDILETLNAFVEEGKTTIFGASNWTAARIAEANAYARAHGMRGFEANQPMWSLAKCIHEYDDTLVQMDSELWRLHCRENLLCTPFSSQAKGYFMKLADGTLSPKAAARYDGEENRGIYARLCALSEETGYTIGSLQLAYLTCQKFPVFPIVGVSSAAQIRELRAAAEAILSSEQIEWIRRMDA